MADRVASDHDAVATHRASIAAVGRTGRVQVELPSALDVADGDVLWVALDGDAGYATVEATLDGTLAVGRVTANRRQAREGEGPDRLRRWVEEGGLEPGDAVEVDAITPGFAYGVRTPGERVVYEAPDPPAESLADIANDLVGE